MIKSSGFPATTPPVSSKVSKRGRNMGVRHALKRYYTTLSQSQRPCRPIINSSASESNVGSVTTIQQSRGARGEHDNKEKRRVKKEPTIIFARREILI
jgi:hypothetical protein